MAHTNVQLLSQFKSSLRGTLCYKLSRLVVCLICLVEPSGSFFIYLFFPLLPYHMLNWCSLCEINVHLRKSFSGFFSKLDHNYYLSKDLHLSCEIPCGHEHIRSKNLLLQYGWDWITPHLLLLYRVQSYCSQISTAHQSIANCPDWLTLRGSQAAWAPAWCDLWCCAQQTNGPLAANREQIEAAAANEVCLRDEGRGIERDREREVRTQRGREKQQWL